MSRTYRFPAPKAAVRRAHRHLKSQRLTALEAALPLDLPPLAQFCRKMLQDLVEVQGMPPVHAAALADAFCHGRFLWFRCRIPLTVVHCTTIPSKEAA